MTTINHKEANTLFVILYKTTHYDDNLSCTFNKYTPAAICDSLDHLDQTMMKFRDRYLYNKVYIAEVPVNELWEQRLEAYIVSEEVL